MGKKKEYQYAMPNDRVLGLIIGVALGVYLGYVFGEARGQAKQRAASELANLHGAVRDLQRKASGAPFIDVRSTSKEQRGSDS